MAPTPPERKAAVQVLRALAVKYDVERVRDTAAKAAVQAMAAALLAVPALTVNDKSEAEKALADFEATFNAAAGAEAAPPDHDMAEAPAVEPSPDKVWCFRACQFTFNHTLGEWASTSDFVLMGLFQRLCAFAQHLVALLGCVGISVTLERSVKAGNHVHAHFYLHMKTPFRKQGPNALDAFAFEGIHPHVVANKASGRDFDGAVRYGHFYVFCDKIGSLASRTTFQPWEDYGVEGWWLDNLLKQGKLARDTYLTYAARVNIGFQSRLQNIRAAERFERVAAVTAHVQVEASRLAGITKPCKMFPIVSEFVAWFQKPAFRRPILAIIGGTNLGKSMLAADILRKVGVILGVPDFLEITVEGNQELDFADFDHRRHAGVLLDGVGDVLMLQLHRETLQGRAKVSKGGQSATNVYAYPFTLANRAVVAKFDLSALNRDAFSSHHWLSNSQNVMQLHLTEPAWIEEAVTPL